MTIHGVAARRAGFSRLAGALALAGAIAAASGCAHKQAAATEEAPAPATPPALVAAATPAVPYDREKSLESFEVVWHTVNDKHWDPAHGGVDWNAVHTEFRPKIEAATSMAEARRVMSDMLGKLGQSHFGIWPQEVYLREETSTSEVEQKGGNGEDVGASTPARKEGAEEILSRPGKDNGVSGLDIRVVGDEALIVKVQPGSAGDVAGIKPGWVLVSAQGQKVERIAKRLEGRESHTPRATALSIMVQHLLTGDVGEEIPLVLVDGDNREVEKTIMLRETTGTPATLGNLPVFYLTIDSRRLPEGVQYFAFSVFMDPPRLLAAFQKAVEEARTADGLIIDLRGNPGGIGALAMGMGGWFVEDDSAKLGTMVMRNSTLNFVLNPRANPYTGPVAILIDGMSGSTSEIMAGGLKDIGRARIFGQRSAGAALPSLFDKLPNGDRLQYAVANYISAGGKPLEGDGVTPDEVATPDRATLLAGRDPALGAAVAWIKNVKGGAGGTGAAATETTAAGTK